MIYILALDRIGHMGFLTRLDRTPKFPWQVLSDQTESGLIIRTFYQINKQQQQQQQKKWKKKYEIFEIFSIFKSPASRKENVRFPDSPDFDNLPDFRTGLDVRLSPIVTITYNNASEWILTHCALCSCYFNAMGTTPFVSDQVCTSLVLVSLFAIQRQPAS